MTCSDANLQDAFSHLNDVTVGPLVTMTSIYSFMFIARKFYVARFEAGHGEEFIVDVTDLTLAFGRICPLHELTGWASAWVIPPEYRDDDDDGTLGAQNQDNSAYLMDIEAMLAIDRSTEERILVPFSAVVDWVQAFIGDTDEQNP